jgi:hypothetical protein
LREAAEARQFRTQFDQAIDPFKTLIASRGVDPLQATTAMMQTHASLTMGTPQQKAQTIAKAIQEYGVDIETLDSVLAAEPEAASGGLDPALAQYLDQRLAPVQQLMGTLQQNQQLQQQQASQWAATAMEEFAANPKNVYFEDVRERMGDLIEMAARRGQEMPLEQAYSIAVSADPQLSKQQQSQQTVQTAQATETAAQRRAAAASSIAPSAPSSSTVEPKDRREAIVQAIDKLGGSSL